MLPQRSIEYVYICAYTVRSLSISIELSVYEMRRRHLKGIFCMEIEAARETGKKKKKKWKLIAFVLQQQKMMVSERYVYITKRRLQTGYISNTIGNGKMENEKFVVNVLYVRRYKCARV